MRKKDKVYITMLSMGKLTKANFYVSSGIFGVLSLAGAALNYALYPVLAHILPPSGFGNFTAIVALSNQTLAVLLAFNVISIYIVKHNDEKTALEITQVIQKILVWFFLAATILIAVFSPLLRAHLKIENPLAFIVLLALLLAAIPAVVWTGYLQGHKRLVNVGVYAFTAAFFKFLLAAIFGAIWGTSGALVGVLFGTIAGIIILRLSTAIKLPKISSVFSALSASDKRLARSLFLYTIEATIVVGGLGILQNMDIVFAKAFFSTDTAGIYSGVSILSNALYYVSFLLIWIILPEIDVKDRGVNRRILGSAYKLLALLAIATLTFEYIFRGFLTQKLLGSHFVNQGQVLIYASLFQLSLVAVTLYAFYLLVLRQTRSLGLAASVLIPCLTMPWLFHKNPRQMILVIWLAVLIGISLYCIINMFVRSPSKNVREEAVN